MAEEIGEHHWYVDDDDSCSCGNWDDATGGMIHGRHTARAGLDLLAALAMSDNCHPDSLVKVPRSLREGGQ